MQSTISRAMRFADHGRFDLERRLIRKAGRRIAKCLGVSVDRLRYDWHDNSFELYGCDRDYRLTAEQYARVFSTGLGVLFVNSDRQEVVYTWWRGFEPVVRETDKDSWRKRTV